MPAKLPTTALPELPSADASIPIPEPTEASVTLDHINASYGPVVATLVNQTAQLRAYVDLLRAAMLRQQQQIETLQQHQSRNGEG